MQRQARDMSTGDARDAAHVRCCCKDNTSSHALLPLAANPWQLLPGTHLRVSVMTPGMADHTEGMGVSPGWSIRIFKNTSNRVMAGGKAQGRVQRLMQQDTCVSEGWCSWLGASVTGTPKHAADSRASLHT